MMTNEYFELCSKHQEQCGIKSLKIVSNDGGGSSIHTSNARVIREEDITIETLDSLNILEPIGFIKMDVEENELFVIKGTLKTLEKSNYPKILFESNNPTNDNELFIFLKSLGYKIINIGGYYNMFLAEHPSN